MFKSGILVMIITLLSRVLGMARTVIIASYFGASGVTDAYFSAFKISNFFRQLLGEGALGTVFIPVYNEKEKEYGSDQARDLIFSILNLLFCFACFIAVIMAVFSRPIIDVVVTGYDDSTKELASKLLKIMAVYFVFIGMSGMIGAVLNNFKQFLVPASTSLFFNIAIISSALFFSRRYGIYSLAFGVVLGGLLQLIVVIPSFIKQVKTYKFCINFKDRHLKKVFLLILPMLVGIFAKQFNVLVDQFFASFLATGGVSALENATRLYNLPLGVFGISIATVVYPGLSRSMENGDVDDVKSTIVRGLNFLSFLIIPSIFIMTFYSQDVIKLVLGYGKYSEYSIKVSSESLRFYSIGLFFYTAIHLLSRSFYGMKNTKDPVKYSVVSIILNIFLNYLLIERYKHIGISFATSVAAAVNFLLLYIYFNKKYVKLDLKRFAKFLLYVFVSAVCALLVSMHIKFGILKIAAFGIIYLLFWILPIKRRGMNAF